MRLVLTICGLSWLGAFESDQSQSGWEVLAIILILGLALVGDINDAFG